MNKIILNGSVWMRREIILSENAGTHSFRGCHDESGPYITIVSKDSNFDLFMGGSLDNPRKYINLKRCPKKPRSGV